MLDVRFVSPDLRRLDEVSADALSLPFFSDERPLRGALGLVDWRLCGRVSDLLARGPLTGAAGETLLLPTGGRLPMEKVFLHGLGASSRFGEEVFDAAAGRMLETLANAHVRTSLWSLPGRSTGAIGAADAMERFVHLARAQDAHDEILVAETADAQREMEAVLQRERRKARALV